MRVLFVSGELIAGDLAYRLRLERCDVRLFVEHSGQKQCLDGFVEKTDDWKSELSWVGKDGLIVFDDVGYGKEQDELRKQGYRVFGGSLGGDRLEKERGFGDQVLRECGLETVPLFDFHSIAEAIAFVKQHPKAWVVKQNTHQSALNYVGMIDDGRDIVSVLEQYERSGITDVTLQEKISGVEIGIARYFNGHDWVGPIEMNIEHKSLFPGNIGPKTGEMGTLVWYEKSEENKLFQETLAKLKSYLQSIDFRGDIDLGVFVSGNRILPIELTARLGCPSTYIQGALHVSPWHEFLGAVADGQPYDLKYRDGYGVVMTIALPPFPYTGSIDEEYSSVGVEIFFTEALAQDEKNRIHFEGVSRDVVDGQERYRVSPSIGYTMFVSGVGESIDVARESACRLAEKIIIPKAFYRNDIGADFSKNGQVSLRQRGWIS